jgi:hypothetical protein
MIKSSRPLITLLIQVREFSLLGNVGALSIRGMNLHWALFRFRIKTLRQVDVIYNRNKNRVENIP